MSDKPLVKGFLGVPEEGRWDQERSEFYSMMVKDVFKTGTLPVKFYLNPKSGEGGEAWYCGVGLIVLYFPEIKDDQDEDVVKAFLAHEVGHAEAARFGVKWFSMIPDPLNTVLSDVEASLRGVRYARKWEVLEAYRWAVIFYMVQRLEDQLDSSLVPFPPRVEARAREALREFKGLL